MTRTAEDEIKDGRIYNGFDYQLQVWIVEGIIQPCAHPESMRTNKETCCNQHALAGRHISTVEWAEEFEPGVISRD